MLLCSSQSFQRGISRSTQILYCLVFVTRRALGTSGHLGKWACKSELASDSDMLSRRKCAARTATSQNRVWMWIVLGHRSMFQCLRHCQIPGSASPELRDIVKQSISNHPGTTVQQTLSPALLFISTLYQYQEYWTYKGGASDTALAASNISTIVMLLTLTITALFTIRRNFY